MAPSVVTASCGFTLRSDSPFMIRATSRISHTGYREQLRQALRVEVDMNGSERWWSGTVESCPRLRVGRRVPRLRRPRRFGGDRDAAAG